MSLDSSWDALNEIPDEKDELTGCAYVQGGPDTDEILQWSGIFKTVHHHARFLCLSTKVTWEFFLVLCILMFLPLFARCYCEHFAFCCFFSELDLFMRVQGPSDMWQGANTWKLDFTSVCHGEPWLSVCAFSWFFENENLRSTTQQFLS